MQLLPAGIDAGAFMGGFVFALVVGLIVWGALVGVSLVKRLAQL